MPAGDRTPGASWLCLIPGVSPHPGPGAVPVRPGRQAEEEPLWARPAPQLRVSVAYLPEALQLRAVPLGPGVGTGLAGFATPVSCGKSGSSGRAGQRRQCCPVLDPPPSQFQPPLCLLSHLSQGSCPGSWKAELWGSSSACDCGQIPYWTSVFICPVGLWAFQSSSSHILGFQLKLRHFLSISGTS